MNIKICIEEKLLYFYNIIAKRSVAHLPSSFSVLLLLWLACFWNYIRKFVQKIFEIKIVSTEANTTEKMLREES
jgi:hypothetical protein